MASEQGYDTLANMIILGHAIAKTGMIPYENVAETMKKVVSAKRADLVDKNIGAVALGYNYKGE